MYGSVFGIARMRVAALLAFALMASIAFGRADAQLLPNTPQPQGGDIVGSWKAENIPVRAYVPDALVRAVSPSISGDGANGTLVFSADGTTVQVDYATVTIISANLPFVGLSSFPVNSTNSFEGNYTVAPDTHQLRIISSVSPDTLTFTYTATADSLHLIRVLPVSELLESVPENFKLIAIDLLNRYVMEDDPMKTVISFVKEISADFDGNGTVDFLDFLAFARVFGKAPGDEGYDARMDLDSSGGAINFQDFLKFVEAFGSGG